MSHLTSKSGLNQFRSVNEFPKLYSCLRHCAAADGKINEAKNFICATKTFSYQKMK